MKPIYDKSGSQVTSIGEYDIATATNIPIGTCVQLVAGKVIAASAGLTTAILGAAAETHTGAADAFNSRNNGLKIKVYDSPTQVFETTAPQITATSGTTTSIVATGIASYSNDDFNGGYAKLISKVAASTNTDPVGTVYEITDFTGSSTKSFTIPTAGGAVTAGDVFAIFPPVGFALGNLDSTFTKYDLTATASLCIKTVGRDIDRNKVLVEATLHSNGNKAS
jgi:hypothetical protein